MNKKIILFGLLAGLSVTSMAMAGSSGGGWYVRLDGDYLIDQSDDSKAGTEVEVSNGVTTTTTKQKATSGVGFGGAIGYNLNPKLALEIWTAYNSESQKSSMVVGAPVNETLNIDSKVKILSALAGARIRPFNPGMINPFISLYAGYVSQTASPTITGAVTMTTLNGKADLSGSGFGYAGGLGAEFNVGQRFAIVPMVNYFASSVKKLKVSGSTSGAFTDGDTETIKGAKAFVATLGFQIGF